jgi:hypothetical protein
MQLHIRMQHHVPTNRATVSLIKVKSRSALLRMLPVCIGIYLKSVLRYKFSILDICRPDILYLTWAVSEDPRLFYGAKRGPQQRSLGNAGLVYSDITYLCHICQGLSRSWHVLVFYSRVCFNVTFGAILYHSVTKVLLLNIFKYFKIGPNVTKMF